MNKFIDFLNVVNSGLNGAGMKSIENISSSAGFSGMISDFMAQALTDVCPGLHKNLYHNGHPDLIPIDMFTNNAVQHSHEGIEIKCSKNTGQWQGHNAEASWILAFEYDIDPLDNSFSFRRVTCAKLEESDWTISGRGENSRRTPTASINKNGKNKMLANWVFKGYTTVEKEKI